MDRRIQSLILKEANRLRCPVHGETPKITFGSGDSFNTKCCCESFGKEVEKKMEGILQRAFEEYIKDSFKKIGVK